MIMTTRWWYCIWLYD